MRYFNISTAFHSFKSRILPMRRLEVAEVIEGEASGGEFLYVKSRQNFQLSKTWPSKILTVFLQCIHMVVFLVFTSV